MNVAKATRKYEAWVGQRIPLVPRDLRLKHRRMQESPFAFFRATFYRWAQLWPDVCTDLAKAPEVLAVGDLHVENFGTWRDIEGRLIWGVNDFDEAHPLPYANDLVRLAVSTILARDAGFLCIRSKAGCEAILEGYLEAIQTNGRAFVLEEDHPWLRAVAMNDLRNPVRFWKKMTSLPAAKDPPASAIAALEPLMPAPGLKYKLHYRVAGLGSLGHVRVVAIAEYDGGFVAREAKALTPSACEWAHQDAAPKEILYQVLLDRAVRCTDPFVKLNGQWIVRRLAPHCSRIDLQSIPKERDEERLLFSMGFETGNVHLGSRDKVAKIRKHLKSHKARGFQQAAKEMAAAILNDWKQWRKEG